MSDTPATTVPASDLADTGPSSIDPPGAEESSGRRSTPEEIDDALQKVLVSGRPSFNLAVKPNTVAVTLRKQVGRGGHDIDTYEVTLMAGIPYNADHKEVARQLWEDARSQIDAACAGDF